MTRFLAFIDRHLPILTGALGLFGIALMIRPAWTGDQVALVVLAVIACSWVVMATLLSRGWKSTLRSWSKTLDRYSETCELTSDLSSILSETLMELRLYDTEKAQELGERANTITLLRLQNMNETEGERNE